MRSEPKGGSGAPTPSPRTIDLFYLVETASDQVVPGVPAKAVLCRVKAELPEGTTRWRLLVGRPRVQGSEVLRAIRALAGPSPELSGPRAFEVGFESGWRNALRAVNENWVELIPPLPSLEGLSV